LLCGLSVVALAACGTDDPGEGGAQAGTSAPSLGSGGTGGASGAGAGAAGVGGAPVTSAGGAGATSAGVGGSAGSGGQDAGRSGGGAGSGGASGSGGAGSSADAGADAGSPMTHEATPSAGCNAATGRPAGGVVAVAQSHYFVFPESYDGTKPFPVLVGFHGCGGVNRGTSLDDTEWVRLTDGTDFETDYVRMVPLSADAGGCWSYANDLPRVTAMYDALLADHCVDTSRVFATGHSSGAQLVVQILTENHTGDAQHLSFKAVAPVAASDYGAIAGPIPVMYIQGMMDAERGGGDGHETVERFRSANGCGSSSMPYAAVTGCQSGATAVTPGCVSYDGCAAPTIWCSHDDPAYSGTMHGVPCFGITAMHDFFESLM
jgi:poly(3-hydroxybutyrate) depolymerase